MNKVYNNFDVLNRYNIVFLKNRNKENFKYIVGVYDKIIISGFLLDMIDCYFFIIIFIKFVYSLNFKCYFCV